MTLFDLMGFAKKAKKMVCGMSNCLNAVIKKKAKLVVIAEDAGVSRKKLIKECELNGVPFIEFGTREQFIDKLGYDACYWAVLSEQIADAIQKELINMKS